MGSRANSIRLPISQLCGDGEGRCSVPQPLTCSGERLCYGPMELWADCGAGDSSCLGQSTKSEVPPTWDARPSPAPWQCGVFEFQHTRGAEHRGTRIWALHGALQPERCRCSTAMALNGR